MKGYVLLSCSLADAGLSAEKIPQSFKVPSSAILPERDSQALAMLLADGRFSRLHAVSKIHSDDEVTIDDNLLVVARVPLFLDPRREMLTAEQRFTTLPTKKVELYCWVSVTKQGPNRLTCGMTNDGEGQSMGAIITNDPSKDDLTRMKIYVVATTLADARKVLIRVLSNPACIKQWIT